MAATKCRLLLYFYDLTPTFLAKVTAVCKNCTGTRNLNVTIQTSVENIKVIHVYVLISFGTLKSN